MKAEQISETMTYGGASTAIASGLTLNQIGVIVGIIVGLVGLLLQWHYSRLRNRREQAMHDIHIVLLTKRDDRQ